MQMFSCSCTVRTVSDTVGNERRVLHILDRPFFTRSLRQFAAGQELELTIEETGIRRTHAQNRFFYGPVCKAFMELGYAKQEAHDLLALRFIPQDLKMLDGSIVRIPGHTASLTKEDFAAFLESCIQLAAEQGIVIEGADDWRAKQATP